MPAADLAGVSVLVTRPAARSAAITALIEERGGVALSLPVVDIVPTPPDELSSALQQLRHADLVIFVSANAVAAVAAALTKKQLSLPTVTVAVVGPATAAECERAGIRVDIVPTKSFDSEGLLAELSGVDVTGKKFFIFRGQDGRGLIKTTLTARGATVRHITAYRRRRAAPTTLAPTLARWHDGEVGAVTVSSVAVFDALATALKAHRALLATTPLFAYSERVAEHARAHGAGVVHAAAAPTDAAVVAALVEWARCGRICSGP